MTTSGEKCQPREREREGGQRAEWQFRVSSTSKANNMKKKYYYFNRVKIHNPHTAEWVWRVWTKYPFFVYTMAESNISVTQGIIV